ncbi:flagellar hook-associated protein FlgL [Aneurinibacillus aneurinilyticus]|jgi:flagellin|nr:flagellar hook-associated protein FlgL [Aneurinibacillus aneurinilyticus]MCI1693966.1 flagellar hook-associated protein FlgL [Aneurinibacillus aneurinilyticus]MED0708257.1 flagellar hook-associated protein FlgL [Aneurinibacillus aneurinilyticus]MED0724683.1 flagellar hook-associated protein FlgL [Aneurinibacillus aneurinilyticus]MED0730562.1 flagellar hook-associated protein FlgL [Aneurinibacillus aneurinilyticus]MED0743433.1 flagellar hook-associated protein FlgL [Aneurinibacillus aneurini
MIINHNLLAQNSHRQLGINTANQAKSTEKLSSGLRINRAGDDAAGLAISEKMRGQIRGLDQASRNSQDGISMIQTAEGALNETHSILQRMRELAVQSSNDTNTESDRKELQKEVNQLASEIDRIANTTEFNTQKLLDGSKVGLSAAEKGSVKVQNNSKADVKVTLTNADAINKSGTITITRVNDENDKTQFVVSDPANTGFTLDKDDQTAAGILGTGDTVTIAGLTDMGVGESVTISFEAAKVAQTDASKSISMQIGANSGQNLLVGIDDMRATALGVRDSSGNAIDITSAGKASTAITTIDKAIEKVSAERSKLGAFQNRLEHTINNLNTSSENLTAAESRIRDTDMAKTVMENTKNGILAQAAQAMLAQANQNPQQVLQLLR